MEDRKYRNYPEEFKLEGSLCPMKQRGRLLPAASRAVYARSNASAQYER